MNKIYKVIWSKAKNCYVVVSELAKQNGKCKAAKTDGLNRRNRLTDLLSFNTPALTKAVMAMLVAGMIAMPNVAGAGTQYADDNTADASGSNSASAYGRNAKATGQNSTAIGGGTKAAGKSAIAVGFSATAGLTQTDAQATAYSELNRTIKNDTALAGTTVRSATDYASLLAALTDLSTNGTDTQKEAATDYLNQLNERVTVLMSNNYAIAVGNEAKALAQDSIAVGRSAQATGQDSIAVGRSALAIGQDSIAVGRGATARGAYSVSIGQGARNRTAYGIAIGVTAGVSRASSTNLPDAGGLDEGTGAIAIGYKASNYTYGTYQSEDNYEVVRNTVAIGTAVHTHAQYAVAIGAYTDATAERSFALGTSSTNNSSSHKGSRAGGQGSVVIGDQAEAASDIIYQYEDPGRVTDTNANDAIAVGTQAHVMAKNAVAMGGNISYTGLANDPYHVTRFTTIYGKKETGEESGAFVGEGADAGIAIGGAYGTIQYDDKTDTTTITIESQAAATYGKRGIAIGSGAKVISKATSAHIQSIITNPEYQNAKNDLDEAEGVLRTRINEKDDAVEYRDAVYSDPDSTQAEKDAADEAVTLAEDKLTQAEQKYQAKLTNYSALEERVQALEGNSAEQSRDAIAIGASAEASLYESIAIGKSAVTGDVAPRSIAFGTEAKTGIYAQSSIAFGTGAETGANAIGSIAFGVGSKTGSNAMDSVAIGINSNADNIRTIAIGKDSYANADHATAIGMKAEVHVVNGVAIGSQSIATLENDKAGTVSGVIGYDVGTDKAFAGDGRFMPTWMSTAGSFSVGGGTNEEGELVTRRITNVAAGASDTEAVNVAQLRRAVEQTVMTSDNRIVGVGKSPVRGLEIISPFYEIKADMAETTEAMSFMSRHNYRLDQYKTDLNKELYGEGGTATNPKENSLQGHLNKLNDQKTNLETKKTTLSGEISTLTTRINDLKAIEDAYNAGTSNIDLTAAEKQELISKIEEKTEKELELVYINQEIDEKTTDIESKKNEVNDKKAELNNAESIFAKQEALYENRAEAKGDHAIAAGIKAKAYGKESIAYGKGSVVGEVDNDGNPIAGKGDQSIALGVNNTVTGNNSIAVGTSLTVSGNNSGAFGDPSTIDGDNSYSVGNGNVVGKNYSDVFALGNHITKVESNSVFLGSNSGYVPADNSSTAGNSAYGSMTIDDTVYPFAGGGNHVVGVVSVGSNENGELITRRIQNVAPGLISADSTDAINGSQLYQAMQALSIDVKGDPTETQSTNVEKSKTPAAETAPAAGGDTPGGAAAGGGAGGGAAAGGGAGTTMEIKLTPATTYTVTASTTTVKAGSNNIKVEEKIEPDNPKSYKYTIDLAKDINVDTVTAGDTVINKDGVKANKFTAGDTTINNDGLTIAGGSSPVNLTKAGLKVGGTTVNDNGVTIQNGPGMTKDGIDAGGKKITNVANGEADTDAVNVGQMKDYAAASSQAINDLGDQISRTDSRSRKGIAGAAALAALHPMDFDPDDKLTFAAGVGNFRGETAAAIGAFYRPDEKVMFSIGGTFGNSENLVNAGISFSLDRKSRVTGSRTAMAKEIVELREQVAQLTALVHQIAGNQGLSLPMPPAMFPNTPENKWAYDYIESLQKQGVLSGYAGRELTRNEMAAALDRALASGAKLDKRITKEFAPELSRIRVVFVNGQVDGEPRTFERPRSSVHEYK